MTEHEHKWKTTMHLDGCHWYTTAAMCECGATLSITHERSPLGDPYSLIWMQPSYIQTERDERGRFLPKDKREWVEQVCHRCKELEAGAPTKSDLVVTAKDGTVEREEHVEHEQEAA